MDKNDSLKEKFTIKIIKDGLLIESRAYCMQFSANEALMLLDILKNEELRLIQMAKESSPLPFRITMQG